MDAQGWLAERFEANRTHLKAVAYRMLGSLSEAEDAVQESWLRLSRADAAGIEDLRGWLTTVSGLTITTAALHPSQTRDIQTHSSRSPQVSRTR
jgi:DNA-directed RNA polymerase specialized sigma24 family protein